MVESKAWDWKTVTETVWQEPAEDVYYFVHRWKKQGFRQILDLGCGIGRHSLLFAENGFQISSFDLSEDGLDILNKTAMERKMTISLNCGDMKELPYKKNSFDCILAYHSIYHTDTNGISCVIAEMNRVLRQDGEIFVTFNSKNNPSFRNPKIKRIDDNTIIKLEGLEVGIPHYYADSKDIGKLLDSFKILRIKQVEDIGDGWTSWHYFVHAKKK